MRVLTEISTNIIPHTIQVGVYGMNIDHKPELHWRWAYPALWCVMIGICVFMFAVFRQRGWIGTGASREAARARRDQEP
jgi:magnesium transporter